jgi:hypothetical protein
MEPPAGHKEATAPATHTRARSGVVLWGIARARMLEASRARAVEKRERLNKLRGSVLALVRSGAVTVRGAEGVAVTR